MAAKEIAPRVLLIIEQLSIRALEIFPDFRELLHALDGRDIGLWHAEPARNIPGAGTKILIDVAVARFEEFHFLDALDYSPYSVVGMCIHGGGDAQTFESLVAKCSEAGATPLGIADSTYYSSAKVVPEVEGLVRCLSADLHAVLDSLIPDAQKGAQGNQKFQLRLLKGNSRQE